MPLPLIALALAAFGIGTTEFVIMGLLPDVASDLSVSIPAAGWLVSGYALAVALGAPLMAIVTAKLPRKAALLGLMGVFVVGNLLCALATGYQMLMVARVVTALCHGAFFGIGAVVAAGLVPENKRASAIALMFTGLTLANVLGVPAGTALGHAAGWRSTFWVVSLLGVFALGALAWLLPRDRGNPAADVMGEFRVLRSLSVWTALAMTVLSSASMFAVFTYIAPLLQDVTGLGPNGVTWTLVLLGIGLTLGNFIGGRLADWKLMPTLIGLFIGLAAVQVLLLWTSRSLVPAELTLFVWAALSFAAVPALQTRVVQQAQAAPNLASTLNIGAFNAGNALGAWAGGVVIAGGHGVGMVPLSAAALAVLALFAALLSGRLSRGQGRGATSLAPSPVSV